MTRQNKGITAVAAVSVLIASAVVGVRSNGPAEAATPKSVVFNFDNPPVVLTHPFVTITGDVPAPFDSLRVVMQWEQPTDGGGNADSTFFNFRSTKAGVFQRANFPLAANTKVRRKFGVAVLADAGTTITFPNTITAFTLIYYPRLDAAMTADPDFTGI